MTITGTNDQPTIVSETNPVVQNVVVVGSGTPSILGQGINTNESASRPRRSTASGPVRWRTTAPGTAISSVPRSMPHSPDPATPELSTVRWKTSPARRSWDRCPAAAMTNYLSVGAGGTETITFAALENTFVPYWGSVDPFDTMNFYNGTTLVAYFTGNDVSPLFANGNLGSFSSTPGI